jgi:hypothetical protein
MSSSFLREVLPEVLQKLIALKQITLRILQQEVIVVLLWGKHWRRVLKFLAERKLQIKNLNSS